MNGVDFEKLLETARLGIRRASIFMGFGVEVAQNSLIRKFDLAEHTKLKFVENTNDDILLNEYKDEFKRWVISSALREIHEGFIEYLEKLNQACLTFGWVAGDFNSEMCDRLQKNSVVKASSKNLKHCETTFLL